MSKSFIPEIAGIRAIALLWMIGFHIVFCFGFHASPAEYRERLLHPSLFLLAQGHLGVDLFFIVSGYVIFRLLDAERQEHGNISLSRFYVRRWLRLFPAYTVVLLLCVFLLGTEGHGAQSWANFFMVNNFLPLAQQAMPWSWSIAIECQFYLAAPWLLHLLPGRPPRSSTGNGRYAWPASLALRLLLILASATAIVGWLLLRQPPLLHAHANTTALKPQSWLHLPYLFHSEVDWDCFHEYFNRIYDKPYGRFAPLLLGASLVAVEQQPALTRWMVSARRSARLPLALAGLLGGLSVGLTGYMTVCISGNRAFDLIALSTYRVLFSLAAAYVFLYVLAGRAHAQPSWLGRLLAARGWGAIAKASYSTYLVHPLIVLGLWSAVAARTAQHGRWIWLALVPTAYGLSLASGAILHATIEGPLHSLGRRLTGRPPSLRS